MKAKAVSYLMSVGRAQVEGEAWSVSGIVRLSQSAKCDLVEEFRHEGVSGIKELERPVSQLLGRQKIASLIRDVYQQCRSTTVTVLKLLAARQRVRRKGKRVEGRKP